MRDPWAALRTTGTWEDHATYSLGGIDKPLAYGTTLTAPAAGVLHTSGRPRAGDEFQCGWVGSAGRRSILILDRPLERVRPSSGARMLGWYVESGDPMVALVFQHQSRFGEHGRHFDEGDPYPIGWSGASANFADWGGDVHLHWHGLTARGERVNPLAYIGAASSGAGGSIIDPKEADVATHKTFQCQQDFKIRTKWQRFPWRTTPDRQENLAQGTGGPGLYDVLLNFYVKDFPATSQIEGRLVVVNAKSGAASAGYAFTIDGSVSGQVRAAIPARVNVPAGSLLVLELRTLKGLEPTLDLWGADIANLVVS
ncbi:hypothetical protein [Agromyces sp. NPDC058064]|uniref:hypothetical protein n=1 Tax=Agromyces sp. NPDC058064 TaxID=3346322 RepID=UPI0036DA065F